MLDIITVFTAVGDVYDLVFPTYIPTCPNGCAAWIDAKSPATNLSQPILNALWLKGNAPEDAGSFCAMPGASAGDHECDCTDQNEKITDSFAGPWCVCANPGPKGPFAAYCTAPYYKPEQINLQMADPTTVVVAFVTYESLPVDPPIAMLSAEGESPIEMKGVSHAYTPPGRAYVLNFVKFSNLSPRTRYTYRVKSGSEKCEWSKNFTFRSPYSSGITRLATYGDMGHSHHNNMGNMLADCESGRIDGVLHMGDHCYNLGMANDTRGDAYMNALQPLLSGCPWFPVIGNHEKSDGDNFNRYLNLTWGEVFGNEPAVSSTATTALGHLLTKGTLYGAGTHSHTNTSRFVSSDLGLIHMVGLDLNRLDAEQIAWLEKDLSTANSNRGAVPWIMVTSHFPIHHTALTEHPDASAHYYVGNDAEEYAVSGHEFKPCATNGCKTVAQLTGDFQAVLGPIFAKYGVDIYNAGHVHDYQSCWPLAANGTMLQSNFINPKGPVHVTEGNGGVPGVSFKNTVSSCGSVKTPWCRMKGTGGAYGRWTAYNSTHITYEHVENPSGNVTDRWTIVQSKHGPFHPNDHIM